MEITLSDLLLLVWAAVASGTAWHYKSQANIRGVLVASAAVFTKHLLEDQKYYEKIRQELIKSGEISMPVVQTTKN